MSFTILTCDQGSQEWFAARAGRVTGSNANWVMSKPTAAGAEAAGRKDYRLRLALERVTGMAEVESFTNEHIQRGHDLEADARFELEINHDIIVKQSGFLVGEKMVGVSLDGHSENFDTIIELKCPKSTTQLGYIEAGKLPAAYRWQVIHGLYVTGAKRAIFGSYDDRMPPGLRFFSLEVLAQDLPLAEYEIELDKYLVSVDEMVQHLDQLANKGVAK